MSLQIEVTIDAADIDSEDIVAIVRKRMNKGYGAFTVAEKTELKEIITGIIDEGFSEMVKTLDDQMKLESFKNNFEKFTAEQFDAFLNSL